MDNFSADAIRIVILDNHTLVRAGLHFIIESQADMQVVGQTGDSNQALSLITSTKPDIILFEHDPENGLSFDIIPDIHRCGNPARLMLVTGSNNRQTYLNAVQSGVLGIVSKTQSPDVLIKAIRKVHAGEVWIEHTLIANLVANSLNGSTPMVVDPAVQSIELLSERERDVIRVIGLGLKNKQIADLLCIGETTVRHHLTSIYSKLGVSDRLELLIFAQRYNLTKIMPDMN